MLLNKFKNYISSICLLFLCLSCTKLEQNALADALALSGSNRSELEAVLSHYSNDSLKLKAAKFLIGNMPGHYSYADTLQVNYFYNKIDSLLISMEGMPYAEIADSVKALYNTCGVKHFKTIEDVRIIKAQFLIENIDDAFDQWKTQPWCKSLDFSQFCEYILPYKLAETQALKSWRKGYARIVEDSLKRIESCSLYRISAFQAAEAVNNCLKNEFCRDPDDQSMPAMYYDPLIRMRIPYSTCEDLCQTGLNVFRAAGIPVVMDYVPLWGYGNRGHSWGVVHAPNGHDMPLVPIHMSPYVQHKINETVSKAYRRTYAQNVELKRLNSNNRFVPQTFKNIFQRDVTSLYAITRDLDFGVNKPDGDFVYLCTTSGSIWEPVAFAEIKDGKARFENIGIGCIYLLTYYDNNGVMQPLDSPFKLDWDKTINHLSANHNKLQSVTLFRKGPLLEYAWRVAVMMENGIFEASNSPDFNHSVKIGVVSTPADQAGEVIVPKDIGEYRYWRYIQKADSAHCYIGELSFIRDGEILKGNCIGNYDKTQNGNILDGERAFDGNVLTPVSFTRPQEAWIGLDLKKPLKVDLIRYVPRSDGDMIEPGDEYELKYWERNRWHSLGRKDATTVSLYYENVPTGAIYILSDLTKGKSERIFLLNDNGDQEWW